VEKACYDLLSTTKTNGVTITCNALGAIVSFHVNFGPTFGNMHTIFSLCALFDLATRSLV